MPSYVETAIRDTIAKGVDKIAAFNKARATGDGIDHPYLTGIHAPMTQELTLENLSVTGTIPQNLDGRYLRIGPNPVSPPNPARYHWFTGDGMVHGIRIADGTAKWYRNRWVRSTHVSQALNEPAKPGPRKFESPVNTNIIGHNNRFYALVEAGGTPVELNNTLDTIAHNPFDDTLKNAFSAHPHRDPETGELHAICYYAPDLNNVYHTIVGTNGRVIREEPIQVEHGPSIHDCAITARFVLIFDLPVTFSMSARLSGYDFPYRWNPDHKSRVGLLPRNAAGTETIWCDVDPCYVYHPCNAFDLEDGRVIVDVCAHNQNGHRDYRGPDAEQIKFERWTINPSTKKVERQLIDATPQEFPRMDERRTGKPYRYAYSLKVLPGSDGSTAETAILKHDLTANTHATHDFGPGRYPGEFVFVPANATSAEDEGWLIGLVIDTATETTDLVILNAQDFTGPPQAAIHLPHRIPPGFHGNWVPAG